MAPATSNHLDGVPGVPCDGTRKLPFRPDDSNIVHARQHGYPMLTMPDGSESAMSAYLVVDGWAYCAKRRA